MGRPNLLRAKSIAALVPNKVTNFLFHSTSLHKMRRRRRSVMKNKHNESCRTLGEHTEDSTTTGWEEDVTFEPSENMTWLQAKALMATLERELSKQRKAKDAVMQRSQEDFEVAQARRASGCRRGFLLSLAKMKRHERDAQVFAQTTECLETLLFVISTEVSQVQALAELSGQEPAELKLFLSAESLRGEINAILSDDYAPPTTSSIEVANNTWDDSQQVLRELRSTMVPIPDDDDN